jgi:hypothetical protein
MSGDGEDRIGPVTADQIEALLDRYARDRCGDLDPYRLRHVLEAFFSDSYPLARQARELAAAGASLSLRPAGGHQIEVWLTFPDDAGRYPRAHGQAVLLGAFGMDEALGRPQG